MVTYTFISHYFRSGVIWQVARKKGHWKTLKNAMIALLEEAYQNKSPDIHHKDLLVHVVVHESKCSYESLMIGKP